MAGSVWWSSSRYWLSVTLSSQRGRRLIPAEWRSCIELLHLVCVRVCVCTCVCLYMSGKMVCLPPATDEDALVRAAKELGIVFETRTPNSVIINVVC